MPSTSDEFVDRMQPNMPEPWTFRAALKIKVVGNVGCAKPFAPYYGFYRDNHSISFLYKSFKIQ
ncbi:7352_t:CDS:2 [Paraglomus brasilianum]|uniref:7352_t:CDS:1 n=1 Tax=Paraglomus brasilianum TaxID=144538 RepID=A0A9N8ZKB3_9GLOM|nr:7352_t:CDS:2 [Paraglomus brasilianum]